MNDLKNKTAIITGGSKGIGKGIVEKFASAGCNVAFTYLSSEKSAIQIEKSANLLGVKVKKYKSDASKFNESNELVENVVKDFGSFDILINNAGITRDNLLLRMDKESWNKVIDINLNSCFNLTKSAVKEFMKKKIGIIINISSIVGVKGNAGQSNYAASKAAIISMSKSLALEYAKKNITVNCISPGYITTSMTDQINEKWKEIIKTKIQMDRFGMPEDVANSVGFLSSNEANYITGQTIHVNGGMYMA